MFAVISLLSLVIAGGAVPDWPPLPDFENRIDYRNWLDAAMREGMDPSDNAYELYQRVFPGFSDASRGDVKDLGSAGFLHDKKNPKDFVTGPWDPRDHPRWEESCRKTKQLLESFKEAASRPYYAFPLPSSAESQGARPILLDVMFPHMSFMRSCTKGLIEAAWRAEGGRVDPEVFVAACEAGLGAARQMDRELFFMAHLVAISIRALVYQQLLDALYHNVFSEDDLVAVIEMLERSDTGMAPFGRLLRGECAALLDFLQYAADSTARAAGLQEYRSEIMAISSGQVDALKTAKVLRKYFEQIERLSGKRYRPALIRRMSQLAKKVRKTDLVTSVLLPDLSRAYEQHLRAMTKRRATRLLYEIHVYRDKHGEWPARLKDLPKDTVKRFSSDPFSGKRLVYKLVDGQPLLYSVSTNGKDDGGKHDSRWGGKDDGGKHDSRWGGKGDEKTKTDYVFWPVQRPDGR